jgi:hypothetical protein
MRAGPPSTFTRPLDRHPAAHAAQSRGQHAGHRVCPLDGPRHGRLDTTTISHHDHIGSEDIEQAPEVSGLDPSFGRPRPGLGFRRGRGAALWVRRHA